MTIARDEDGKFATFAWPGGYPVYHLCDDGECLCAKCANDPKNNIHINEPNDGWRIIGSDINWDDTNLMCVHCGQNIESAYGEPSEP